MNQKIKFIYFDLGGVIFNWRKSLVKLAEKHNISIAEIYKVFYETDVAACKGYLNKEQLDKYFQRKLKLRDKTLKVTDFCADNFEPIIEIHNFIRQIAKSNRLGLLSNIRSGLYPLLLEKKKVPHINFQAVIQSCDLGLMKPELAIYKHAHQKSQVRHEEILFIDDLVENLVPARKLGWQTVLFNEEKPDLSIIQIKKLLK